MPGAELSTTPGFELILIRDGAAAQAIAAMSEHAGPTSAFSNKRYQSERPIMIPSQPEMRSGLVVVKVGSIMTKMRFLRHWLAYEHSWRQSERVRE